MAFYSLTARKLKIDEIEFIDQPSITLYPSKGAHVEGHKGILSYRDGEIIFKISGGKITMSGEDIKFEEITPTDVYVTGNILSVISEVSKR
jgi:sporulation protein YqfC